MFSSVTVYLPSDGYTYTFSGVISVQHHLSLKIQSKSDSETGEDYINGARNQPDKVILTVVETEVFVAGDVGSRQHVAADDARIFFNIKYRRDVSADFCLEIMRIMHRGASHRNDSAALVTAREEQIPYRDDVLRVAVPHDFAFVYWR